MKTNAKVYVMRDENGRIKVGHAKRPDKRVKEISAKGLRLLSQTDVKEDAERIERTAHRLLKLAGKHIRGEWFNASHDEALAAILTAEKIVNGNQLGLVHKTDNSTVFTMRVDAEFLSELDELRALDRPLPSKAEVLRSLVKAELARRKFKKK